MHLLYRVPEPDATRVTFHWHDDRGRHTQSHNFAGERPAEEATAWDLPTGKYVKTLWAEYEPAVSSR